MNGRPPEIPPHKLVATLRRFNLLPAIVFLPTRRKCDEAASEVGADKGQKTDPERFTARQILFEEFALLNPDVRSHKHAKLIVNHGISSHHAGHLPAWKLLIEKMMSAGLLNAIFATSTVAAGVDFPARSVVISNADTRGNEGWRPLSASELQQMTGRAGRRGKDNVGFAILVPGQFQNPRRIAELLQAPPDPLESRFRATYTSLLNLLDAFGSFEQVRDIAEKSYAFHETAHRIEKLRTRRNEKVAGLEDRISKSGVSIRIDQIRGFERLTSARHRLDEGLPASRADLRQSWLADNVIPGRIVSHGRSGKRLFLVISVRGDSISAMRDDGQGRTFPLSRVNRVYSKRFRLNEADVEKAFFSVYEKTNPPIDEPKLSFEKRSVEGAEALDRLIAEFAGDDTHDLLWSAAPVAHALEKIDRDIDYLRRDIWQPFQNRARVLDYFGYLDFRSEQTTDTGKWLADVRVDRPLLIGEALRNGIFDTLAPGVMAGLMASLAADSDRNYGDLSLSNELLDVIADFEDIIYDVSKIEWRFGIEPIEEINLSAAASSERWAAGISWNELVRRTQAEEGDLVRLLSRTGEALLQIADLRSSNPKPAAIARETAEIILREPVR